MEDNRQERAPGKQSQKRWRTIDIKFSEKGQPGKPGTVFTARAGVSQGLPRRIQSSFGPVTVGHLPFFPLQMKGFC